MQILPYLYSCVIFSRATWAQLQDQLKARTKRLASAAEIHGFNRDLNDLITRLQEKDAALSMEDLGRDMASVQGLQRKHEGHERELLVVQQQVETLNAESGKLQAAYEGNVLLVFFKRVWASLCHVTIIFIGFLDKSLNRGKSNYAMGSKNQ